MAINSNKKDLILGTIGALIFVGSLVFMGVGAKRIFRNGEFPSPKKSSKQKKEAPSSSDSVTDFASSSKQDQETLTSQKQGSSTVEVPPESLKKGSAAVRVPSKPAEEPSREDIDSILIEDGQCTPSEVKKRERSGIVLEVTARDQAYLLQIEGTTIQESFEQNQTKTVSLPAFLVDSDTISFQCEPLP